MPNLRNVILSSAGWSNSLIGVLLFVLSHAKHHCRILRYCKVDILAILTDESWALSRACPYFQLVGKLPVLKLIVILISICVSHFEK